jgi:predicted nuclease of predicted toxin-antitoxin system
MKLLLDQGLPRSAAAMLRNIGFDVTHVAEIGLSQAEER